MAFLSICMQQKSLFVVVVVLGRGVGVGGSSGRSHVGSLFTNEEQGEKKKMVGSDILHTPVTHAGRIHDVTN